jgi:hypothetical protein
MSKVKVLGTMYGIEITKPWSMEMYEHNDKVAIEAKQNIFEAINAAHAIDDYQTLSALCKCICGYGMSNEYDIDEVHNEACRELDNVQNHWLHTNWNDFLKLGVVDVEKKFIGYEK